MHDIRPYLPDLFTDPGTLLYVGARLDACSWLSELAEAGHVITLLEIWPANTENFHGDSRVRGSVFVGDVRDIDAVTTEIFDRVFWWHGPEHVEHAEIGPALKRLEVHARRLVALASPWGIYEQGAHEGNPHETHRCYLYPEDFHGWGYETATDGEPDRAGSEVVAWKRLDGKATG